MVQADGVGVCDDEDLILPSGEARKLGRETGVAQDRTRGRYQADERRRSRDGERLAILTGDGGGPWGTMLEVRCGQWLLGGGTTESEVVEP